MNIQPITLLALFGILSMFVGIGILFLAKDAVEDNTPVENGIIVMFIAMIYVIILLSIGTSIQFIK